MWWTWSYWFFQSDEGGAIGGGGGGPLPRIGWNIVKQLTRRKRR